VTKAAKELKMRKKSIKKTFGQMNVEERNAYVKRYEVEFVIDRAKPLSVRGKALWKAAKRGRPRKNLKNARRRRRG
jgi:hypothetical protein